MLFYKNSELSKTYNVSLGTVRNWIEAAAEGKLDLVLHIKENRNYIANTEANLQKIEQLVLDGKKYRNKKAAKTISPSEKFYKLYRQDQILDIISNLDIYREIPFQYGYFNSGANYWDKYANRLAEEDGPNFLNATVQLLNINADYLDHILEDYKKVNVIDVGAGNALPVKNLLHHLQSRKKMGRYIALDISPSLLEIAKVNINSWFKNSIAFEGYEIDINHDRFSNILIEEIIGEDALETINLVLVLGGTLVNMRDPAGALRTIHESINKNDLMVYSIKLDSEAARRYFDFGINNKMPPLDIKSKMVLDLLNIDESLYDVEMGYDTERRERYMRIRLKVAISINFTFSLGHRTIELNKNDTVILWRYQHQTAKEAIEQVTGTGFDILQTSQTKSKEYILMVSRLKSN